MMLYSWICPDCRKHHAEVEGVPFNGGRKLSIMCPSCRSVETIERGAVDGLAP